MTLLSFVCVVRKMVYLALLLASLSAAIPPGGRRIQLNTGAWMPLVNLGGTSQSTKPGNHYSNYSDFLTIGGRGLDTALTYTDALNKKASPSSSAVNSL